MKKSIVFLLITLITAFVAVGNANAQLVKSVAPAKATLTNADTTTISFGNVENDVVSFQAIFTKATGTAAGKVYLQGTNYGSAWETIDSLTISPTALSKVFNASTLKCASYRFLVYTSGTVTGSIAGYKLRRSNSSF